MTHHRPVLLLSTAILVLSLVESGGGDEGNNQRKTSYPPIDVPFGRADLPQLGAEIEAATGIRCLGGATEVMVLQVETGIRILPMRELKAAEIEAIRGVVANHRPVHPGAGWDWQGGYPPRSDRAAWQKLYSGASSDTERIDLLARFAGLKE